MYKDGLCREIQRCSTIVSVAVVTVVTAVVVGEMLQCLMQCSSFVGLKVISAAAIVIAISFRFSTSFQDQIHYSMRKWWYNSRGIWLLFLAGRIPKEKLCQFWWWQQQLSSWYCIFLWLSRLLNNDCDIRTVIHLFVDRLQLADCNILSYISSARCYVFSLDICRRFTTRLDGHSISSTAVGSPSKGEGPHG